MTLPHDKVTRLRAEAEARAYRIDATYRLLLALGWDAEAAMRATIAICQTGEFQ